MPTGAHFLEKIFFDNFNFDEMSQLNSQSNAQKFPLSTYVDFW